MPQRIGKRRGSQEKELEQRKIKARLIAQAYLVGGIDGIALGAQDWALGLPFLKEMITEFELPVLAANLYCDGQQVFPSGRVVRVGDKRVALVGMTSGEVEGCEIRNDNELLRVALSEMGPVDLTIGLLAVSDGELLALLDSELQFDMVVSLRGKHASGLPVRMGRSWLLESGNRGKQLGKATFTWMEGANGWAPSDYKASVRKERHRIQTRLEFSQKQLERDPESAQGLRHQKWVITYGEELAALNATEALFASGEHQTHGFKVEEVALGTEISDHPDTVKLVDTALTKIDSTHDGKSRDLIVPRIAPANSVYAGGEVCAACHRDQHAQWASTPHSRAWQTLVKEKRTADLDCYGCHATGVDMDGGPDSPSKVMGFHDIQCEACHGPSRAHAENPSIIHEPGNIYPTRTPTKETCITCHDGEMDMGRFDFDTYWPKVVHTAQKPKGNPRHILGN